MYSKLMNAYDDMTCNEIHVQKLLTPLISQNIFIDDTDV